MSEMKLIALTWLMFIVLGIGILSCMEPEKPMPRLTLEQQQRVTAWAEGK